MESRALKPVLAVYVALFILFLYGPFIVLTILSFQQGPEGGPQFPIVEWSTYWYRHIFGMTEASRVAPLPIGQAMVRSLTLAFATMVVSTVLGVMSAQAFRKKFKGSGIVFYLIVLGMIVPGLLTGLGVALVAKNILNVDRHWWSTAFVQHVVYTFPFAFLVMLAILNRFDSSVEEASWSLGVSPAKTFRKVTFPLIFPGVLSAMLFAFTLSYDEFSRTLLSSNEQTLPLAIYGTFAVEIHPNLFAFGVLTTLFSFSLLTVYAILMTLSVRRAKKLAIQEDIA
jgi:putative spermidine/putrescine transport system permease protein